MHTRTVDSQIIGIISDILLWGVISCLVFLGFRALRQLHLLQSPLGREQTILFHDANQLTAGSPVNFIGTEVGYVTAVKPEQSHVNVTYRLYDTKLKLPDGARYTIEFNGLVGAKTLEILPPNPGQKRRGKVVENPTRVKDLINTQMVAAKALELSADNMARSLDQIQAGETLQRKLANINQGINETDSSLVSAFRFLTASQKEAHNNMQNAVSSINQFDSGLNKLAYYLSPVFQKTNTMQTARDITAGTEHVYGFLVQAQQRNLPALWKSSIQNWNVKISMVRQGTLKTLPIHLSQLGTMATRVSQIAQFFTQVDQALQNHPLPERLNRFKTTMRRAAQQTEKLNEKKRKK